MERIRVATLQYFIRPVRTYEEFEDQVVGLVETAADYDCQLMVFPEYFTVQLLTLGDVKRPMPQQIRDLANQAPRFLKSMRGLASANKLTLVAGSIPVFDPQDATRVYNECYVIGPTGAYGAQGKLNMTRFEAEQWLVSPRDKLKLFDTVFGKMAVTICYDVEFPEIARAAALQDAHILVVPSCTDDRQSYLRVRYCAQARAVENQIYVVHASTVGSLPMVPAVSLNYGQAAILTPSDFPFSRDGILAEGIPNQEAMVIGELNLSTIADSRDSGTVRPLKDSIRAREFGRISEIISL